MAGPPSLKLRWTCCNYIRALFWGGGSTEAMASRRVFVCVSTISILGWMFLTASVLGPSCLALIVTTKSCLDGSPHSQRYAAGCFFALLKEATAAAITSCSNFQLQMYDPCVASLHAYPTAFKASDDRHAIMLRRAHAMPCYALPPCKACPNRVTVAAVWLHKASSSSGSRL